MANLGDSAQPLGQADQFVGLVQRGGQRFFNENIDSRFHQCASNFKMLESGNRDRGSLRSSGCRSRVLDGPDATIAEHSEHGISARTISMYHEHHAHSLSLPRWI